MRETVFGLDGLDDETHAQAGLAVGSSASDGLARRSRHPLRPAGAIGAVDCNGEPCGRAAWPRGVASGGGPGATAGGAAVAAQYGAAALAAAAAPPAPGAVEVAASFLKRGRPRTAGRRGRRHGARREPARRTALLQEQSSLLARGAALSHDPTADALTKKADEKDKGEHKGEGEDQGGGEDKGGGEHKGEEGDEKDGDGKEDDGKEGEEEEEAQTKPWEMTEFEKVWLQMGWLLQFFAICIVFMLYMDISERVSRPVVKEVEQPEAEAAEPEGAEETGERSARIVRALWGKDQVGWALNSVIVLLSLANWLTYSVMTEVKIDPDYNFFGIGAGGVDVGYLNAYVEMVSLVVFTIITIARLIAVPIHPEWRQYGVTSIPRYMVANIYIVLELLGLFTSFYGIYHWLKNEHQDDWNLLWLFLARSFEMLEGSVMGFGTRRLKHMIMDDSKLLLTSFVMGFVVWLVMSGLYFVANYDNPNEEAKWEFATYNGEPWMRFESIPSTMWFVLINLLKEHPLASVYTSPFQRLLVIISCIFAMPLFAIPASILQYSLFKQMGGEQEQAAVATSTAGPTSSMINSSSTTSLSAQGGRGEASLLAPRTPMPSVPEGVERGGASEGAIPTSLIASTFDRPAAKADGEAEAAATATESRLPAKPVDSAAPEPEETVHNWFRLADGYVTGTVAIFSIVVFFYYTARNTDHPVPFGLQSLRVTPARLAVVDFVAALYFFVDWIVRIYIEGTGVLLTFIGFIDLVSWVPGLVHGILFLRMAASERDSFLANEWLCAACVLRVLKLERYFHSFRDMKQIMVERRAILAATMLLCFLTWMLFSELLFLTERSNPDPEMFEVYGSNMRALWAELVNLHGEWPWADYTAAGKGIGTVIGFFSIMIFCIPISIFGEGFKEKIDKERDPRAEHGFDRRPWVQLIRPEEPGFRRAVYDLLYAHLHVLREDFEFGFKVLRVVSVLTVAASTTVTLVNTMQDESLCEPGVLECSRKRTIYTVSYFVDGFSVVIFLADYICRIIATGWRHPCSLLGVCDVLSLGATIASMDPNFRHKAFHPDYSSSNIADDCIVPLRLLRLFSLESYFGAMHALRNVMWLNRWPLARAGFTMVSTWFAHATLLYLFESDPNHIVGAAAKAAAKAAAGEDGGDDEEEDELSMKDRYCSVLRALQYSIVHLFGDFPETDYNFKSKVLHFVGILFGIGIVASFIGVFSAGFTNYLREERRREINQAAIATLQLATRVVTRLQRKYRARVASRGTLPPRTPPPLWQRLAREVAFQRSKTGKIVMRIFNIALIVSLLNTLAASMPEIEKPEHTTSAILSLVVEMVCTALFIVEYAIRIIAAPRTIFNFFRVMDFICLLPGVLLILMHIFMGHRVPRLEHRLEALVMIRAIRILDYKYFHKEVTTISRALQAAAGNLGTPAYLSLNVWITSSSMFMWLENMYKAEGGESESMTSVPAAMYWCCIFLVGEWANVDFTYAGSRMCIFYVIFGVAIFSIPVGILVEAIQSAMMISDEERKTVKQMLRKARQAAPAKKLEPPTEVTSFNQLS